MPHISRMGEVRVVAVPKLRPFPLVRLTNATIALRLESTFYRFDGAPRMLLLPHLVSNLLHISGPSGGPVKNLRLWSKNGTGAAMI